MCVGGTLTAIALVMVLAGSGSATGGASVEDAVAAGQWDKVTTALGSEEQVAESAPYQFLLGHASLAMGRHNDAAALFAADRDSAGLADWEQWCLAAGEKYTTSPVVHYLLGDALARQARYEEAIREFSASIDMDDSFALAHNARGVAYSVTGERSLAYADWYRALEIDAGLADGYANLVVYMMEGGGTSEAAEKRLRSALDIDPGFGMALNSRACVLAANKEYTAAGHLLILADSLSNRANPYVVGNAVQLLPLVTEPGRLDSIAGRVGGVEGTEGPRGVSFTGFGITAGLPWLNFTLNFAYTEDRGGVYLTPSTVEVVSAETPARFTTNYLLCYPREEVRGSLN